MISRESVASGICQYAWHMPTFANTLLPASNWHIPSRSGIDDATCIVISFTTLRSTVNRNVSDPDLAPHCCAGPPGIMTFCYCANALERLYGWNQKLFLGWCIAEACCPIWPRPGIRLPGVGFHFGWRVVNHFYSQHIAAYLEQWFCRFSPWCWQSRLRCSLNCLCDRVVYFVLHVKTQVCGHDFCYLDRINISVIKPYWCECSGQLRVGKFLRAVRPSAIAEATSIFFPCL